MKTTLIKAFDNEGGIVPKSIFLFVATHDDNRAGTALKDAIGAAFRDWYIKTKEGRVYVDENGVNWGDATMVPDGLLKKHGVHSYDNVSSHDGTRNEINLKYDDEVVVDHNEDLFDIGEADEVAPDLLADEVETEEEGASRV